MSTEDDDQMVSDLGDDEIKEIAAILAANEGDQHAVALRLALTRALPELIGHRAARAADKARIKAVVAEELNAPGAPVRTSAWCDSVAARAAERLATAWPPPDGRVALHPSLATDKSDPTLRAVVAEKVWNAALDEMERSVTGATASEVLRRAEVEPA